MRGVLPHSRTTYLSGEERRNLPAEREEERNDAMRQVTVLSKVLFWIAALLFASYIVLCAVVMITGTAAGSKPGGASEIFAFALIVGCCVFACAGMIGDFARAGIFRNRFRFDPWNSEKPIQEEAQNFVSQKIEGQRQVIQNLFRQERALAEEKRELLSQKVADTTSFTKKQEQLGELKGKIFNHAASTRTEKRKFWRLCKIARWWGYKVPESVNESAAPPSVAAFYPSLGAVDQ